MLLTGTNTYKGTELYERVNVHTHSSRYTILGEATEIIYPDEERERFKPVKRNFVSFGWEYYWDYSRDFGIDHHDAHLYMKRVKHIVAKTVVPDLKTIPDIYMNYVYTVAYQPHESVSYIKETPVESVNLSKAIRNATPFSQIYNPQVKDIYLNQGGYSKPMGWGYQSWRSTSEYKCCLSCNGKHQQ